MALSQWLLLVFLSVLWGGSFFFVGVAVHEVPALTLVFFRVAIAAAALLVLVRVLGHALPRGGAAWLPFVIMAILNNIIPFLMITIGQKQIASGLASVLNATTPLWTVVIAHVFTQDEKLTLNRAIGVIIGICGVAVLMGPKALTGEVSSLFGMLCVIAGTVSYGFAGLWGRRLRATPPLVTAACQLIASSLLLLPVAAVVDNTWALPLPSTASIVSIIGLALLSTALAYIVFFHIMQVSGPTNVMLVTLLIPVSAVFLGTYVLGEVLTARQFAGAAVIGSALVIFDGRLLSWLRGRGSVKP